MGRKKITKRDVLRLFYKYSRPLGLKDIYKNFSPNRKEKHKILNILEKLETEGEIIPITRIKSKKIYGLVKGMELIKGDIELHKDGYGFLIPDDKRRKDVFISKENLKDAWHGDKVVAAILPHQRGKSPEGRVVRVVKKKVDEIAVILLKKLGDSVFLARPADTKLPFDFIVDTSGVDGSRIEVEQIVIIKPTEFYEKNVFFAKAERILGRVDDVKVQEEIVKIFHSIPRDFPKEVLEEVRTLKYKIDPEEIKKRVDLRDKDFVTIDGENARDFDDSILVLKTNRGYKLFVAIADVTHYVKPTSALDKEARERGNSYYFPLSVEPMFPPELSNDICSLNPDEDRLVVVVEMDFNKRGERKNAKFYGGVIRSKKRLTYSQVNRAILEKSEQDRQEIGERICGMLEHAKSLAEMLYKKRTKRGSIDFEIPEPVVLFEDLSKFNNFVIKPRSRLFSHQIIEEFMIAANEAVAEFLTEQGLPCMYRVHPEPDEEKLASLFNILENTGIGHKIPEEVDSKSIQEILKEVKGRDFEFLVNRLLLRSMMQASYSPKNTGHFGLASDCYCHFTSPIRRYADVVVHRILKSYLGIESYRFLKEKRMVSLGEHLSNRERVALSSERDIFKRLTVILMKDRVGERFTGIISSVMDFGFFVEIKEVWAEGMVRLSTLLDDYYIYDHTYHRLIGKRTGRIFQIGNRVNVMVWDVNLNKMEIDLKLYEDIEDLEEEHLNE